MTQYQWILYCQKPESKMYGRKRMAKFRPNSEIIGKFRKLKKFYDHFVKREK